MSNYNEFETREEAEKWAAGVIAGLLSFGALATRISEIETEDKKIDTPEIESPDISVPSVNMNLGKNFGLSNIPADKLITIIFSLLMIIFIILSTIKGVKIKREDIVKDLLDGKFAFSFSVNGPTKFYLMSEGNKDFTLSGANEGNAKVIPGLVAPPFVDENSPYLHAKNNGMSGMVMHGYFAPSANDVSIIANGVTTDTHIDQISGYDLQVASFGDTKTERVTVSDFVPEQLDDGTYGTFEFAEKRWYSNVVDGAFLLKYCEDRQEQNILTDEVGSHNISYMIPIKGIEVEYRPLKKLQNGNISCVFKRIIMETRDIQSTYSSHFIVITNNNYPKCGEVHGNFSEDGLITFNPNYSSLEYYSESAGQNRTIRFYGFRSQYAMRNDSSVQYYPRVLEDCNLTVEMYAGSPSNAHTTYLSNRMPYTLPAFDCGTGSQYVFNGTSANGYNFGSEVNYVQMGLVKSIAGNVDGNTSAYFQDIYSSNGVSYSGEGFSAINGWFVADDLDNPFHSMTAHFSLGYTTMRFTSNPSEKGKPVHKVQLMDVSFYENNYRCMGMRCYYYDEYGSEKMWELKMIGGGVSNIRITPAYSIPTSSSVQDSKSYPFKSTDSNMNFGPSQYQECSSKIYDVIEGEDESEWPSRTTSYRRMFLDNTSPKTTYEQQKTNDYIRAANVKGTSTIDVDYSVGVVDTNPHTDFNIASPCTVEVEVPDCYTDPPPQYSEGLDKARAELRCDEMYLVQIFGTDYMNLKTNDMSFAESYIPDCECGKIDRFFERY